MKMIRFRKPKKLDDKGVAAIEFGFIAPFLFIIFFGLIDLTQYISASRRATNVSSVIADLASQVSGSITPAMLTDFYKVKDMVYGTSLSVPIRVEVVAYRKDNAGTAAYVLWDNDNGVAGVTCTRPSIAKVETLMTNISTTATADYNDVILASVCMSYQPFFKIFDNGTKTLFGTNTFSLQESTLVRPRSQTKLNCIPTAC